jgi:hypothetical protein
MTETLQQAIFRHPRRLGFIAFNLIALAVLVSWVVVTQDDIETLGIFGLPYYALGYLGIFFLIVAWVGSWLAWIWMVARRRNRDQSRGVNGAAGLSRSSR